MAFTWDIFKHAAANELAKGKTDVDVCSLVLMPNGKPMTDRTLRRWKSNEVFMAKVAEIRTEIAEQFKKETVRVTLRTFEARAEVLEQLIHDLLAVKGARAEDPERALLPGGDTGLLRSHSKVRDMDGETMTETSIEIDKDLIGELRQSLLALHKMQVDLEGGEKTLPTVFLVE